MEREAAQKTLCLCGCGQPTGVYKYTDRAEGNFKGQPTRFVYHHNLKKELSNNWHGGISKTSDGYVIVLAPGHPHAISTGYVREHILVVERVLGHPLPESAEIHHANGDKADNRNANLVICENHAYHLFLHRRHRAYKATGHTNGVKCKHCGAWGIPEEGGMHATIGTGAYHRACDNQRKKRSRQRRKAEKLNGKKLA